MTLNNDVEQDDCLLKGRCVDVDCTHFHKLFLLFPSQGLRGFQNAQNLNFRGTFASLVNIQKTLAVMKGFI